MGTVDYTELLKGSIDDISSKFKEHDDDGLAALLKAEKAGSNRKGLVDAIEREQGTRKADADAKASADAGKGDATSGTADPGEKTYSQGEVDAIHAEHATALATAREEDRQRIAALEGELAEAQKANAARKPAKAIKTAEPRKLALLGRARGNPYRIAFADERDMSLVQLPELQFGPGDFEPTSDRGGVTLTRPIDFDEGSPMARISSVWLVDPKGEAHAVSRFVQPLGVGGGASAQIPAKSLNFVGGKVPNATDAEQPAA